MILGIDHIAVAVADFEGGVRRYVEDLGLSLTGIEEVPAARTKTAFVDAAGIPIELVHPLHGEGPIAAALEKRGPGIHHLALRTDDLDGEVARLKVLGWQFTSDTPTSGAHGSRVIFAHPRSTGGVLIELVERRNGEP